MNLFMGVDVGNTKTTFLLCDEKGHVLSYVRKKGANFQSCGGIDNSLKIIEDGIKELLDKTKFKREDITSAYFGIAGADRKSDFELIGSALKRLKLKKIAFQNDGFIALKSGSIDGCGILITCGTGNTNFASNCKEIKRIGGLSPQLGDVLGTRLIASKITSAIVRAKDGRGPKTILKDALESKLKMEVEDLISVDLEKYDPVPLIVESFFEALRRFDVVAFSILESIVKEISRIAEIFRISLFPTQQSVKLILDGPFFKNADPVFFEALKNCIWDGYKITVPRHDPVVGAVLLAMEMNGKTTREVANRMIKEYLQIVQGKKV